MLDEDCPSTPLAAEHQRFGDEKERVDQASVHIEMQDRVMESIRARMSNDSEL